MADLDDIRQTFLIECEEQLEVLADGLSELQAAQPHDPETVNAMFRAVHSIKGGAASFGMTRLVTFAHSFETALDAMRDGRLAAEEAVLHTFLRAADHLSDLVADGEDPDALPDDECVARIAEIEALSGGQDAEPMPEPVFAPRPIALPFAGDVMGPITPDATPRDPQPVPPSRHRIRFRPSAALYANGHDPVHLFRALAEMGSLAVTADLGALGSAGADPTEPVIEWTLTLEGAASTSEIAEVFEFVEGLADLDIAAVDPAMPGDVDHSAAHNDADAPASSAPFSGFETDTAVLNAPAAASPVKSQGDAASGPPDPPADAARPASERQSAPSKTAAPTMRVKLDLVDELISLVGELVINQSVIAQAVHDLGGDESARLERALDEFRNLARQLQEGVMAIRAQSVKPLFQRMARIVRETADMAGKPIEFQPEGETTELDRTVIERLVDPLTHIIRNAIDHGLETSKDREAAGKPPRGRLRLSAAHQSGRVLIELSDDGRGIDRARVLEIAIARGLVAPDANLAPAEIDRLLFQPGFSTAREVTDLSGRGVGMDVVNREIRKLGGRIGILSNPGLGTTISISLPLTLAVLEGMIVEVSGQTMVVPISAIIETIRPDPASLRPIGPGTRMINVRGRMIPVIDMAAVFGWPRSDEGDYVLLLVQGQQDEACALMVDAIHDQRQVVIRSLEANYGRVAGVAAATILGDGRIALIVDPEEIAQRLDATVASKPMEISA